MIGMNMKTTAKTLFLTTVFYSSAVCTSSQGYEPQTGERLLLPRGGSVPHGNNYLSPIWDSLGLKYSG